MKKYAISSSQVSHKILIFSFKRNTFGGRREPLQGKILYPEMA